MNDQETTVEQIKARLRRFNSERAWGQYHQPRNLAMALSVEAAELLALFLWCRDDGPQPALPARNEQLAEEAADVAICLLNLCQVTGVDLAQAVEAKLARNAEKYPVERVKGRMEKYDEY